MKQEILSLLRARRDYVSGQELCEQFGVSPTAVWKAVEQLKNEGYSIEMVHNRGYLLQENVGDIFCGDEISRRLHTTQMGQNLLFYPEIDSTNIAAKQQGETGAPEGTLIVADQQTAGRGRRGRSWLSPAGSNVYFTLLLRPQLRPEQAPTVTLVMALAVVEGIERLYLELTGAEVANQGCVEVPDQVAAASTEKRSSSDSASGDEKLRAGIKWPNDIVIGGKKVCGILTEMSLERESIQYVVIGVGINVKKQEFAPEIAQTATSLEEAWGITVSRSALVAHVMDAFEPLYEKYLASGDLTGLKDLYESRLVNLGKNVRVLDPQGEYQGIAKGINQSGELLVLREDTGEEEIVYAGEVSVRGIYGYV